MLLYEMLIAIGIAVVLVVAAIDRLATRVMIGPEEMALLRLARAAAAQQPLGQFPIGCKILKVPLNGGTTTTLVDYAYLADFTVDGTNVYFLELGSNPGSIRQIPVGGGTIMPLVSNAAGTVLVNDAAHVYWIDPRYATVLQFPKAGGTSTNMVTFQLGSATDPLLALDGLAVDSNGLYSIEAQAGTLDVFF